MTSNPSLILLVPLLLCKGQRLRQNALPFYLAPISSSIEVRSVFPKCNRKDTQGLVWLFLAFALLIDSIHSLSSFMQGMPQACKQSAVLKWLRGCRDSRVESKTKLAKAAHKCIYSQKLRWELAHFGLILQQTFTQMHFLHPCHRKELVIVSVYWYALVIKALEMWAKSCLVYLIKVSRKFKTKQALSVAFSI